MRRRMFAIAAAAVLAAGTVAGAAGAAAATLTPAYADPRATSPSARDGNATVCAAAAKTVSEGFDKFAANMDKVSSQAGAGDLTGAEEAVRDAGADLVALSEKLVAVGEKAEDPQLRTAVLELADEFERLGKGLDSLTSLQNFDTTRLDKLAKELSTLCGSGGPSTAPSSGQTSGLPRFGRSTSMA